MNLDFVDFNSLENNCHVCKKKFKWRTNLVRHLNIHAESINKPEHKCGNCDKLFSRNDCLIVKMKN